MKSTDNKIKKQCMISDKTIFTDSDVREATSFNTKNSTIEQVDKIPIHAISLVIVNSRLCSTLGINFHVNITHLDLHKNFLQAVDLKFLVNLEYLDLSANYLKELDSISENTKIKTLNIASNEIQKVNFIAALPQLQELNFQDNMVQDLEPIFKHSNFSPQWAQIQKELSIQKVIKIDSIPEQESKNTFWRYINSMVIRYRDLIEINNDIVILCIDNDQDVIETVFLDYLKVTKVFVSRCHNISFSEGSKLLTWLWICNSEIQSLYGMDKMVQLENLTLRQCSLSRIQNQLEVTKKIQKLRYLDVAQNGINNSEYVCNEKLQSLNLSQNNLKSLGGLRELSNLTTLDVSGNYLDSVAELADLTDLMELNISFNTINSIQCLNRLKKLIYFNLMSNKVLDIENCIQMKNLLDLRTKNNRIQNEYVLTEHPNVTQTWFSEQLKLDTNENNQEVQKLKEKSKNNNILEKYKNKVQNNSLTIINNDQYIKNLKFSDFIGVTKQLSLAQCKNISFEIPPTLIQSLKVNGSGLQNILGLEQITQIKSLELNDNLLEDVIEIQELTKLARLVLSNNRISRLDWIQALTKLKYLDIQNNKFVSIKCLKDMQSIIDLFIQGNMIQDVDYLRNLKNYNQNWNSPQKNINTKDIEYYLGPNRTQQMVSECTARFTSAKKYLPIAFKYKSNISDSKLEIKDDTSVIDLAVVSFLQELVIHNIDSVSIDNCPNVLCDLYHPISSLTLTNCKLQNISNLTTSLTHLDLGFNNLEDVSALGSLTNLQKLVVSDNQISQLDSLKSLNNLVHFDARNNKLEQITVQNCNKLQELYLKNNKLKEITQFGNLTQLQVLDISENQIQNVDSLKGLIQLTKLLLSENQIQNVDSLFGLVNLTMLSLFSNQIQNVDSLKGLIKLTTLFSHSNQIQNIEPLKGLVNLKILYLLSNQIQNLEPLKELVNLTSLSLSSNQIQNVEPLRGFVNLTTLDLSSNQIQNIEPLKGLVNLTTLDLRWNQIMDFTLIQNHPNFKNYRTGCQK
ncbi:Conserved_hypothetical protein [Hexamita inflata]|uniref:Uncharacterized protein n=2 Tax=Hexamita inflata TaxID=28002 RepID=A0AA86R2D0_9EUKA|nr:Conserved hypothetical protein [Hexamita inflata]